LKITLFFLNFSGIVIFEMKGDKMKNTGVAVWDYNKQKFIPFIPCPGQKRVRIDVFDSLDNYAGFPVNYKEDGSFDFLGDPSSPCNDWEINYS
jgi:hypothetical protein